MAPTHFIHLLANLDFVIVLALFEVEELVTDLLKKSLSEILFQEVYVWARWLIKDLLQQLPYGEKHSGEG